jgi:hypothetical protein
MISVIIAIIVATLFALFAGAYYQRSVIKKKAKLFLWLVRLVALALLVCAFIQPSFTLKTLAKDENDIAIFIDASRSMGLFKLDSLLLRLSSFGDFSRALPKAKPIVRFFCFGDSVRPCDPSTIRNIPFTDSRSFFPKDLSKWRTLIILSDGNWSNPSIATALFENKNCYYLPLPAPSPRPFLHMQCISFQSPVAQDSLSVATLNIQGFKSTNEPLDINVRQGAKPVLHRLRAMNSGYFNDTLLLTFPTSNPGRFLYSISVKNTNDSLRCLKHLVASVIPSTFLARIATSAPTLDARFLTIALGSDPAWKMANTNDKADALFCVDWDALAKKAFSELKPLGVAAFIGCLPCSSQVTMTTDTLALLSNEPNDSLAQRILQRKLPSPASIVTCPRSGLSQRNTILDCVVRQKRQQPARCDTLPFLFEGSFSGHSFVAFTSRNTWSMVFLPLGLDQENETGSLLRDVLSVVKESAIRRVNRTFFMYPSASEINEFDSCPFRIVMPPEMIEPQSATAGVASARIDFSICRGEHRMLDTTFTAALETFLGTQTFMCRPMPAGTYSYSARLSLGKKQFSWADTMIIGNNDIERSITGQNTVLLNQIAAPLSSNDPRLLSDIIDRNSKLQKNALIPRVFQLKRSWLLLGIILALFCLEWAIRRKEGLDG